VTLALSTHEATAESSPRRAARSRNLAPVESAPGNDALCVLTETIALPVTSDRLSRAGTFRSRDWFAGSIVHGDQELPLAMPLGMPWVCSGSWEAVPGFDVAGPFPLGRAANRRRIPVGPAPIKSPAQTLAAAVHGRSFVLRNESPPVLPARAGPSP
jgi:hypothetical protein